jgi:hypothetical protein
MPKIGMDHASNQLAQSTDQFWTGPKIVRNLDDFLVFYKKTGATGAKFWRKTRLGLSSNTNRRYKIK